MRFDLLLSTALFCVIGLMAQGQTVPKGFSDGNSFRDTFFIVPNGDPPVVGPMVRPFIGAGLAGFGGGNFTKVGFGTDLSYARFTEGAAADHIFSIWGGPTTQFTMYLPPDRTSLSQLPPRARAGYDRLLGTADDLDAVGSPWTVSRCPRVIAALEWARFHGVPIGFQMQNTGPQGGQNIGISSDALNIDRFIEAKSIGPVAGVTYAAKFQCALDASNVVDQDDDSATPNPAGSDYLVNASFATPSLADPRVANQVFGAGASQYLRYREMIERNIKDSIDQLIWLTSDPADSSYDGLVAAIALDPEIHMPANFVVGTPQVPEARFLKHPTYTVPSGSDVQRPLFTDYNPVIIRQFQLYLEDRYGDSAPNTDTNGDGRTFWSDFGGEYAVTGWPGLANVLTGTPAFANMPADPSHPFPSGGSGPANWNLVDPPRNYPATATTVLSPYWHEWINFKAGIVKEFVDDLVRWVIEGGCPPDRVYTHQTEGTGSFQKERAFQYSGQVLHWCDDLTHIETSFGRPGISHYTASYLTTGWAIYPHVLRMDDDWGAPEFNPSVASPTANLTQIMLDTWSYKGHVIWPHSWNQQSGYDCFDGATHFFSVSPTTALFPNWTTSRLAPVPSTGTPLAWDATSNGASYMQSPPLAINASNFRFAILEIFPSFFSSPGLVGDLRIDFQNNASATWHSVVVTDLLHASLDSNKKFVVDMTEGMNPASNWVGTITALRLYLTPLTGDRIAVKSLAIAGPNAFTSAMKNVMVLRESTPRPGDVPALAISVPFDFAAQIPTLYTANATGNFAYYGSDPVGTEFTDFGYLGNFEPTTGVSGGVAMSAIRADVPTYLGRRATGRFRKLAVPDLDDLYFTFSMGLADGSVAPGGDGAGFRIVVRDESREQIVLFESEWHTASWSPRQSIRINSFRGQTIEVAFETRGLAKSGNEIALWGDPRIEQRFLVSTTTAGTGTGTISPNFPSPTRTTSGTSIVFSATPAPGSVFVGWTTTGNPADLSSAGNPTTTLTVNGPHQVTATFALSTITTVYGRATEDGWLLESATVPNTGGSFSGGLNSTSSIRVGDGSTNTQYKGMLSFVVRTDMAPAIPANATIDSVRLRLTRGTVLGNVSAFGSITGDLVQGSFGSNASLAINDWQSAPSGLITPAFTITTLPTSNGQQFFATLAPGTYDEILSAATVTTSPERIQIRIAFTVPDDGDSTNDYLGIHSAENSNLALKPLLEIFWH